MSNYVKLNRKCSSSVLRLAIMCPPSSSLEGNARVAFDYYRKGDDGMQLVAQEMVDFPRPDPGKWIIVDGGVKESTSYKSRSSYSGTYKTEDGGYSDFVVSVFDAYGNLIFQKTSNRDLNRVARSKMPLTSAEKQAAASEQQQQVP